MKQMMSGHLSETNLHRRPCSVVCSSLALASSRWRRCMARRRRAEIVGRSTHRPAWNVGPVARVRLRRLLCIQSKRRHRRRSSGIREWCAWNHRSDDLVAYRDTRERSTSAIGRHAHPWMREQLIAVDLKGARRRSPHRPSHRLGQASATRQRRGSASAHLRGFHPPNRSNTAAARTAMRRSNL